MRRGIERSSDFTELFLNLAALRFLLGQISITRNVVKDWPGCIHPDRQHFQNLSLNHIFRKRPLELTSLRFSFFVPASFSSFPFP